MDSTSSPQTSIARALISLSCWKRETATFEMLRFEEQREMRRDVSILLRYSMLTGENNP